MSVLAGQRYVFFSNWTTWWEICIGSLKILYCEELGSFRCVVVSVTLILGVSSVSITFFPVIMRDMVSLYTIIATYRLVHSATKLTLTAFTPDFFRSFILNSVLFACRLQLGWADVIVIKLWPIKLIILYGFLIYRSLVTSLFFALGPQMSRVSPLLSVITFTVM